MHWLPLDSSVFTAAAYVADKRTLYLRFRSGELYRYFEFPSELYHGFLAADSKGQYFAHHIRDRFSCEHVPRSRSASSSN
jgi:hypothetical protein